MEAGVHDYIMKWWTIKNIKYECSLDMIESHQFKKRAFEIDQKYISKS